MLLLSSMINLLGKSTIMKCLLFVGFLAISLTGVAQTTMVPDANFEQKLINLGLDNVLDGQVLTTSIDTLQTLSLGVIGVQDLTGIEDFIALKYLYCQVNSLSALDVSQNINLIELNCGANNLSNIDVTSNNMLESLQCYSNNITSIDLTQSNNLRSLHCWINEISNLDITSCTLLETLNCESNLIASIDLTQNQLLRWLNCGGNLITNLDISQNDSLEGLTFHYNELDAIDLSNLAILRVLDFEYNNLITIDVSQNPLLETVFCWNNQLVDLDLSQNGYLLRLRCDSNQLSCLSIKNGYNTHIYDFVATNNPNLTCIEVDDPAYMDVAWSEANGHIDSQMFYSNYCSNSCTIGLEELENGQKQLLKIIDVTGRETDYQPNKVLLFIYTDGTVERVFHLD